MEWWKLDGPALGQALGVQLGAGLTAQEAADRRAQNGKNVLPEAKGTPWWVLFGRQFSSVIVWLLIVATLVAGALGHLVDVTAIVLILVLNAVIGFAQEYKAERSIAALRRLTAPTCRVLRLGKIETIAAQDLVVGDVVSVEAGDRIPADGRFILVSHLVVDEAALSGESHAVHKQMEPIFQDLLPLSERKNMGFMGTCVVEGKGHMVICATARDSELGKIATLLEKARDEQAPLQRKLQRLGTVLVGICLVVVAVVFALGIWRQMPYMAMLLTSLSLAVAAIPEGLPAVVTISLAIGVQKMVRKKALIRRLCSVETLGCASVICSDKTGTLTQNEMVVKTVWTQSLGHLPVGEFSKERRMIDPAQDAALLKALTVAAVCTSAQLDLKEGQWKVTGDFTEGALLVAAQRAGLSQEGLRVHYPVVGEIPFDSHRKRMSVFVKTSTGLQLFIKGAAEEVLSRCTMAPQEREKICEINREMASAGLRTLALAERSVEVDAPQIDILEENLTFVAIVAMMDTPRPEVKEAIEQCRAAGVRTLMITGDQRETAFAIAKEIGLIDASQSVLEGKDLDAMDEEQLKQALATTAVFARATPTHKYRIVKALKELGEVVAVTGDGVNDAPAIKEGDIGIAMGITGTDLSKEASDMVILDDNFVSIVHAIKEGRGIYDNILKFVNYLLSSNIAELILLFVGLAFGLRDAQGAYVIPLTAVQLLWLNLVTDGMPAISLSLDPIAPQVMRRPPRPRHQPIITKSLALEMGWVSLLIAAASLATYIFGLRTSASLAQTLTLTTFVVLKLIRVHIVRMQSHMRPFSNPWVLAAILLTFAFQVLVIYTPPLRLLFGLTPLAPLHWGLITLLGLLFYALSQINWFSRIRQRGRQKSGCRLFQRR